ncbi:MAG: RDD family protein [Candidatus Hermodarchaeota archaeon]
MKFCPSCGSQNDPDAMFCVICGEVISSNGSTPPKTSFYSGPGVMPTQEYASAPSFVLASWPARFVAWVIDGVVLVMLGIFIILVPFLIMFIQNRGFTNFSVSPLFLSPLIFAALLFGVIGLGYGPLMEYFYGATIGKMILKLKVVDVKTGEKPTEFLKVVIANLSKIFDLLLFDVLLGLIIEDCSKMNQRLLQNAVGLVVIRNEPATYR